jgi:hypothetical protein
MQNIKKFRVFFKLYKFNLGSMTVTEEVGDYRTVNSLSYYHLELGRDDEDNFVKSRNYSLIL